MAAHPPASADPHAAVDAASGVDAAHGAAAAEHGASGGFPPFEAVTFGSQLFFFVLTFAALYFVLSNYVLPAIGSVLEKRAGTIKSDLDQAATKSAAAEEARVNMERAVAKARNDARTLVDAARADVQAKLGAEQEAAEKRIADRISAAEAKVDAARATALAEIGPSADALARDIVAKVAPQLASGAA